jgi:Rod binding domain-containing protein
MTAVQSLSPILQKAAPAAARDPKLWSISEDFESVFLGSMFGQVTSHLTGDGPLGGDGPGADAWRGMLTDELGKSVTRAGGVGIAPTIYRELLALQGKRDQ